MEILRKIRDFFKEDQESKLYLKIFSMFIFIAIFIPIIFKVSKYGYELEIKDYFNFAGSFGGAIFGGIISLIILKTTLIKQKQQFDKQHNNELLNDVLNEYKEVYCLTSELREKSTKLYMDINNYIYRDNPKKLVDDVREVMVLRDRQYISGLIIKDNKYVIQENKIINLFNEIFDLTNNIDLIKISDKVSYTGELLKIQLNLIKELIIELENKKYNNMIKK